MINPHYAYWDNQSKIEALVGKRVVRVEGLEQNSHAVELTFDDGRRACFLHRQDCCESVVLYEFDGDIGGLITSAEASTNCDNPPEQEYPPESFTWTFYTLHSERGTLHMRWLGESNGYYGEEVDVYIEPEPK